MAPDSSRRRFLTGTVAACSTLVGTGRTLATDARSALEWIRPSQTIRFDGELSGWIGRTPQSIAGETNPTLALKPGRTYHLTWKNTDGRQHNVALLDADGDILKRSPFTSERGAIQTVTFTATHKMFEYICEAHPGSMRGDIAVDGRQTPSTQERSNSRFMPWGPTVEVKTVADGPLSAPLGFEIVPDDTDRRCIVDQVGKICVHGSDGLNTEPFLDITNRLVNFDHNEAGTIDERGLLGLAFHPQFQQNGKFYVRYSAPAQPQTPPGYSHIERLSEFTTGPNHQYGQPNSERIVLDIPSPHDTHNGGSVTFGPDDGYLYMGMGDGGGSKLEPGHADDWYKNNGGNGQNVDANLLGSILRIDIDHREGDNAYAIPDSNPLIGKAGLDEHYAWGFRNPWRMSFTNGRLFVADVGESNYEEVDIVEKGQNYGWNVREGRHCYSTESSQDPSDQCPRRTPPDVRGGEPLIDPIIEYPHTYEGSSIGLAVIGGYVYANDTLPALQGTYVFGDFSQNGEPQGSLFAATPPTDKRGKTGSETKPKPWSLKELQISNTKPGTLGSYILGFGRDGAGELYVLTTDVLGVDPSTTTGQVRKLVPNMETKSQADVHDVDSSTTTEQVRKPVPNMETKSQMRETSSTFGAGFGILVAMVGGLAAIFARVIFFQDEE